MNIFLIKYLNLEIYKPFCAIDVHMYLKTAAIITQHIFPYILSILDFFSDYKSTMQNSHIIHYSIVI